MRSNALREQLEQADRRLQLRAAEEIRVPRRRATGRRRDPAASRRHLAHAARGEEHGQGQGTAAGDGAARRERKRGPAHFAARGVEAVRAGGAAVADDEDPARPGRDLRPGCAAEAAAAAAAGRDREPVGQGGRPARVRCRSAGAAAGRGARTLGGDGQCAAGASAPREPAEAPAAVPAPAAAAPPQRPDTPAPAVPQPPDRLHPRRRRRAVGSGRTGGRLPAEARGD